MTQKFITATFKSTQATESALLDSERIGVTEENLSLIMSDETRGKSFNIETDDKMAEMSATGASVTGFLGAIVGSIAVAGTIAIPGLNLVVAGPLIGALTGLGAGAAAGGMIGALVGVGIPEYEAKLYEDEIKNGGILIAVQPEDDEQAEKVAEVFEKADAYNIAA